MASSHDANTDSPLLYDALTAYLSPLLQKHAKGSLILYDDLMSAWDAAQAVLKRRNNGEEAATNKTVSQRLFDLHQSQRSAYQESARADLSRYAESIELLERSQSSAREYLQACLQHVKSHPDKPDWKNVSKLWEPLCKAIVTKRVQAILLKEQRQKEQEEQQKQAPGEVAETQENEDTQPMEDEQSENEPVTGDDNDDAEEEEDGGEAGGDTTPLQNIEDEEEGEVPGEEQDMNMVSSGDRDQPIASTNSTKPKQASKKTPGVRKRSAAVASGKKTLVKKKVGSSRGRAPRGRRGGRGGANASK